MGYSSRFSARDNRFRGRRRSRRGESWRGSQPRARRRLSLAVPPEVAVWVLAGLVVGGLAFLYIRQGTLLQQLTADRETASEELTQLEEINHSLAIEIEEGFSLQRLSRYASEQLGMVPPSKVYYVRIPKSSSP
jgi:cell division protein FtsL